PTSRGVDNFTTARRENGWSARHFAPGGSPGTPLAAGEAPADAAHANVPNVYAELGSVWGSVVGNPTRASWLLSKLIYWVGPKRVVWGTDALWGGSPQGLIEALRAFQMSDEARSTYNLPWGVDGDVDDPTQLATDPRRTMRTGPMTLGATATLLIGVTTATADYHTHPELKPSSRCGTALQKNPLPNPGNIESLENYTTDCQPLYWDLPATVQLHAPVRAAYD